MTVILLEIHYSILMNILYNSGITMLSALLKIEKQDEQHWLIRTDSLSVLSSL